MKKQSLFALLLLGAFLTSCGIGTDDESESRTPIFPVEEEEETPSSSSEENSQPVTPSESSSTPSPSPIPSDNPHNAHRVYHYVAKEATCTEAGNLECWYCVNDHSISLIEVKGRYNLEGTSTSSTFDEHDACYIEPLSHHLVFDGYEWKNNNTEADACYHCDNEGCNYTVKYHAHVDVNEAAATCTHAGSGIYVAHYGSEDPQQKIKIGRAHV